MNARARNTSTDNGNNDPRAVAFGILRAVLIQKLTLSDAMAADLAFQLLKPDDRAFASFLVRTTIRRLG